MEIFQKKSIETLEPLVITLTDFEDLKDQSRSKNVGLNKKGWNIDEARFT